MMQLARPFNRVRDKSPVKNIRLLEQLVVNYCKRRQFVPVRDLSEKDL